MFDTLRYIMFDNYDIFIFFSYSKRDNG